MNCAGTPWTQAGRPISWVGKHGPGTGSGRLGWDLATGLAVPPGWLPGGAAGGAGSASSRTEAPSLAWRELSKYVLSKQTGSFLKHLPGERALRSPSLGTQTGGGGRGGWIGFTGAHAEFAK